jgi:hypothetical protein
MTFYRRPPRRTHVRSIVHKNEPIAPGSFLYNIITPIPTVYYKFEKLAIYKQDDYLKLLEKNNREMGLPFVNPNLPIIEKTAKIPAPQEPDIEFSDQIKVNLRVLKNGIVRVKINCAVASMYEKYKKPPIKVILQAYKAQGYSQEFLDRIKKRSKQREEFSKKVPGIIDKIFNKEPVKKIKKVKKVPVPDEIPEEEPEEELEEDVIPLEEGEMDVEVEVDDEEQQEEYVSDVEE